MFKKLVLLCILFTVKYNAQKVIIESINDYPKVKFTEHFNNSEQFLVADDKIFLTDQLSLTEIDKEGLTTFDLSKSLDKNSRKDFALSEGFVYHINNDMLAIRNGKNVFLFDAKKNKFKLINYFRLKNKFPTKSIYHYKNKIYLFGIYNEHPKSDHLASGFLALDTKDSSESTTSIPFNYLPITHIAPNHFIDFYDSGYLVCDPFFYKVKFYNLDGVLKDSICAADSMFTPSDTSAFRKEFNKTKVASNPSSYIQQIGKYATKIDRIWTVNFIDSATIFIRLTRNSLQAAGEGNMVFYDHIWKKINGVWQLILSKDLSHIEIRSNVITKNDLWPNFLPGSKQYFKDGFLYYAFWTSGSSTLPQPAENFYGFAETDRSKLFLRVIKFSFDK